MANGSGSSVVASGFWDIVKQDPNGNWYSPGFTGPTYLTNNPNNYIVLGPSQNNLVVAPQYLNQQHFISPGKCDIQIIKEVAVDINKKAGSNYAKLVAHGIKPPIFDIHFKIWTADQWVVFVDMVNKYVPIAGTQIVANYACQHPILFLHNINAIQIYGLVGPKEGPEPRTRIFTMKCIQFQPVPSNSKGKTVTSSDPRIYSPYETSPSSTINTATPGTTTPPSLPASKV